MTGPRSRTRSATPGRRRWLLTALVGALVLAAGADRFALYRAEQTVSSYAVSEFGASGDVETQITAVPYLTSLYRGRLPRVVIHADVVTTATARLTDVTIDARGVGASGSYMTRDALLSAVITTPDLERVVSSQLGLPVSLSTSEGEFRADVDVAGTRYTAEIAPVIVQAGTIGFVVSPEGITAADGTTRGDDAAEVARALTEVSLRPVEGTFPWVEQVQVDEIGLRVSGESEGASAREGEVY